MRELIRRLHPAAVLPLVVLAAVLALLALSAGASAAPAGADATFARDNAQGNLAEIAAAKVILARSHSEPVRSVATEIETDHQAAQARLVRAAGPSAALPTAPSLSQAAQAATLRSESGIALDRDYLQHEAVAHRASIAAAQAEITSGTDPALVAYAKYYVPVAQRHLGELNQAILDEHGGSSSASAGNASPVPPPGSGSPTAVATAGDTAHGSKTRPSSDLPWVIGLAVLAALALGGAAAMFARGNRNRPAGGKRSHSGWPG